MMQQHHLTAWQMDAPWPRRSQIEQDLRLSRGVAAIFNDDLLREHLAMRGGTVLHKAHLAPAARYSEDIDLVLVKPMDGNQLEQHLRRILSPILGRPTEPLFANAWLALRNVVRPSRILRVSYKFVPLGLQREETIKVEVNLNENASLYPLVDVTMATLDDGHRKQRGTPLHPFAAGESSTAIGLGMLRSQWPWQRQGHPQIRMCSGPVERDGTRWSLGASQIRCGGKDRKQRSDPTQRHRGLYPGIAIVVCGSGCTNAAATAHAGYSPALVGRRGVRFGLHRDRVEPIRQDADAASIDLVRVARLVVAVLPVIALFASVHENAHPLLIERAPMFGVRVPDLDRSPEAATVFKGAILVRHWIVEVDVQAQQAARLFIAVGKLPILGRRTNIAFTKKMRAHCGLLGGWKIPPLRISDAGGTGRDAPDSVHRTSRLVRSWRRPGWRMALGVLLDPTQVHRLGMCEFAGAFLCLPGQAVNQADLHV